VLGLAAFIEKNFEEQKEKPFLDLLSLYIRGHMENETEQWTLANSLHKLVLKYGEMAYQRLCDILVLAHLNEGEFFGLSTGTILNLS